MKVKKKNNNNNGKKDFIKLFHKTRTVLARSLTLEGPRTSLGSHISHVDV